MGGLPGFACRRLRSLPSASLVLKVFENALSAPAKGNRPYTASRILPDLGTSFTFVRALHKRSNHY
jgi:hypothetical protein